MQGRHRVSSCHSHRWASSLLSPFVHSTASRTLREIYTQYIYVLGIFSARVSTDYHCSYKMRSTHTHSTDQRQRKYRKETTENGFFCSFREICMFVSALFALLMSQFESYFSLCLCIFFYFIFFLLKSMNPSTEIIARAMCYNIHKETNLMHLLSSLIYFYNAGVAFMLPTLSRTSRALPLSLSMVSAVYICVAPSIQYKRIRIIDGIHPIRLSCTRISISIL